MNKVNKLFIVCSILILSSCKNTTDLGSGYFIVRESETIQFIRYAPLSIWLIRGKVKINHVSKSYICGYLSTAYYKEDDLIGLEGKYDKEGYFFIWKKKLNFDDYEHGEVVYSGLTESNLLRYGERNGKYLRHCL